MRKSKAWNLILMLISLFFAYEGLGGLIETLKMLRTPGGLGASAIYFGMGIALSLLFFFGGLIEAARFFGKLRQERISKIQK